MRFREFIVEYKRDITAQKLGRKMYDFVKSKGYSIQRSSDQTDAGKGFWNKYRGNETIWEDTVDEPIRIKIGGNDPKVKAWIEKVYNKFPQTFQNNHVMPLGGEGDEQQFALFELVPSFTKRGAVEVKWIQAYPLRQGVGTRAMRILQDLAQEDRISLTLYPWDKGQVSQSKLIKFYKKHGFVPVNKSKNMIWEPKSPNEN